MTIQNLSVDQIRCVKDLINYKFDW